MDFEHSLRLFIAFPLPSETQEYLAKIQASLHKEDAADSFRWIKAQNTHITLHFLGDIAAGEATIPKITGAMQRAVEAFRQGGTASSPIRCKLGKPGAFPSKKNPRVLWIGLNEFMERRSTHLLQYGKSLFDMLESELLSEGIQSHSSSYKPHITLGYRKRSSSDQDAAALLANSRTAVKELVFSLGSICLFKSYVTQDGRTHEVIFSQPL